MDVFPKGPLPDLATLRLMKEKGLLPDQWEVPEFVRETQEPDQAENLASQGSYYFGPDVFIKKR